LGVATSTTTDAIGALLKQCGYQVWVVYDGQEALSKAVVDLPEAVLLDIGIPSIDGIEGPPASEDAGQQFPNRRVHRLRAGGHTRPTARCSV